MNQTESADADAPLSAAQRCNEYVLLEIFQRLKRNELTTPMLTCRAWLPTARAVLYRSIRFNTITQRSARLEPTLRSSALIRALIRHLVIAHPDPSKDHLLDWLALMPEDTLLSLNIERMPMSKRPLFLLRYPAIRTTLQITIGRSDFLYAEPSNLTTILSFPRLEGLSLLIRSLPLYLEGTLRLNRLSLGIMAEDRPQLLETLLRTIEPHCLHNVDILLPSLPEDNVGWITDLLQPHLPNLRHFAIRTLDHTKTAPIMDNIIEFLPRLSSLACGRNTYTAKLFPLLPSQLESLTLDSGDNEPFPRDELDQTVTRLCDASRRTFSNLIVGRHPSYPNTLYFDRVARTCQSFGVSFVIRRGRIGEYLTLEHGRTGNEC